MAKAWPIPREWRAAINATHDLVLGHGLAVDRLRQAADPPTTLGITLDLRNSNAASDRKADLDALRQIDALENRIFLEPLLALP